MASATRRIKENKDIVRRDIEEVWNKGNLEIVDEYVADAFVCHDPAFPEPLRGPDGYKQLVTLYRDAFPDAHLTIHELVAEDDSVVARWTGRGTHEGELMGVEPSNAEAEVSGMTLVHIEEGMVTESWQNYDLFGMLGQLGALPGGFGEN